MKVSFFKDVDGVFWFDGNPVNRGDIKLANAGNGQVLFKVSFNESYFDKPVLVSDVLDADGHSTYTSFADIIQKNKDFFVDAALAAAEQLETRVDYLEAHAYDTLWIDFWQVGQPTATAVGQVWFNTTDTIKAWNGTVWNIIPIDFYKLYVKASVAPREVYAWSGSAMVSVSVPLTKPAVEALIYNGTDTAGAGNIDLAIKDIFTRTVGINQQYAILNPILYKPFRLILTGGTLNATLFTGYTSNWILTSLRADYVPANANYLWCEIRSAGQIYLFWGA